MDYELDLMYFREYINMEKQIPQVKESRICYLNDILGLYCMGGEL